MEKILNVPKIMCNGCADTITSNLSQMPGIDQVSVDVDQKTVTLQLDETSVDAAKAKLAEIGYPAQD